MDKEKLQENIENYLDNNLTGDELTAFESVLKKDASLQKRLSLSKSVEKAFRNHRLEEDIKPNLKALGKKYVLSKKEGINKPTSHSLENKDSSNKTKRNLLFLLIGIIGIGILSFYSVFKNTDTKSEKPEKTSEQIFAAHFTPLSISEANRGANSTITNEYEKAIEAYQEQNYTAALPAFEAELTASPDNILNKILLSNIYLSLEKSDETILLLEPLSVDESHFFTKETQWYLALAYLQKDKKTLALPLLETLSNQAKGKYTQLAKNLLEDI